MITQIIIIIIVILICLLVLNLNNYEKFEQTDMLKYADIKSEYESPFILHNLLNKEHTEKIILYSKNKLIDSEVMSGKNSGIRNSKQTWINKNDPLVKPIYDTIFNLFKIPIENAEDLQIVRYQPNQYYKEHHDSCCDEVKECKDFVKRGGQRILTVLIYLNNDFEGGETYFKNLNMKFKVGVGDAIVFHPLSKNEKICHPYALHEGLPINKGEKWIANIWFRERKFT